MSVRDRVRVHEERLLSDNWYVLKTTRLSWRREDGQWQEMWRETYDRGNGAVILPYDPARGTVLLGRQFRYPAFVNGHDGLLIEAAAGLLDAADPAFRIRAEAEEELGLGLSEVTLLWDVFMSPGSVTERLFFFTARYSAADRVSAGGGLVSEGEEIGVLELSLREAMAMIADGRIRDAKTIMLLQHAALVLMPGAA